MATQLALLYIPSLWNEGSITVHVHVCVYVYVWVHALVRATCVTIVAAYLYGEGQCGVVYQLSHAMFVTQVR